MISGPGKAGHVAYPRHGLWHTDTSVFPPVRVVDCEKPLVLPLQVPVRGASPADLFCLGCKALVPASAEQVAQAKAAAAHEGFVERTVGDCPPVLPGTISAAVRRGLFWLKRLQEVSLTVTKEDAEKDIAAARPEMRALGMMDEYGGLTSLGETFAGMVAEPVISERIRDTDDPALAPAQKKKRRSRKATVAALVPRCGNTRCWSPLGRDGKCTECDYVETRPERLAEIVRCWDLVDQQAPERKRKAKGAGGSAEKVA